MFLLSFLFINKTLRLNNLKSRTAMNAKISVFIICVEAIIYLLLYNLHDCTFKCLLKSIMKMQNLHKTKHFLRNRRFGCFFCGYYLKCTPVLKKLRRRFLKSVLFYVSIIPHCGIILTWNPFKRFVLSCLITNSQAYIQ